MSIEGVEDIYPLSPTQAGMVFHALANPSDGVYTGQVCFRLRGPVDEGTMRKTWKRVVARHAVLRAGILWEDLEEPLQVIHSEVDLPWARFDWRGKTPEEQAEAFEAFKIEDREAGFELATPPLMRLSFFDLGKDEYWLVWTSHHAIADGWSISTLLGDMASLYASIEKGVDAELPPAFSYNRYIAWLKSRDAASAEKYWRGRLAGFREPSTLLTPRPAEFRTETDTHDTTLRSLSRELTGRLRDACQVHRISLFTLVQAAWGVLLGRYCERDDVVFGVTTAGRPPELNGIESAVGLFLNTLPVRHRPQPGRTVREWLQDVQADARDFLRHETTPLPRVKGWSDIADGSPLFDTILVMTNYPKAYAQASGGPGWSVERVDVEDHSNYALALVITPESQLELKLVHDSNAVSGDTARQLLADLESVLATLAREPDLALEDIPLPAGDERDRLLREWAQGKALDRVEGEGEDDVLDDWQRLVREQPERPALVYEEVRLSRVQLDQGAEKVAGRLRTAGIEPGDRVAICLEPCVEVIESILGVLKTGAAYVPIDPSLPARRIQGMLEDSGSRLLLTHSTLRDALSECGLPLMLTDREENPRASGKPDPEGLGLAYVLFTSGSTGRPKGVAVTRANLAFSTRSRTVAYPSQPSVFLLLSAFFFDSSVAGIFWTLTTGGTLVLARKRIEQDMDRLGALIGENGVSHTLCLPGLYRALLEHLPAHRLSSLDTVILAGEVLPPEVVRRHRAALPAVRLYNEYGPTEGTVWCTYLDTGEWGGEGAVPIGRPIPGAAVYILDAQQRLAPAGIAGELCVAGPGVTRGYMGSPGTSDRAFVTVTLDGERQRMYRTGDTGRYLSDGVIEFIGRRDEQVKIRGHRIELAEIEAVLLEHPGVEDAVAVVLGDPARGESAKRLAAFIQASAANEDTAAWKPWLREHLPEHMVPQRISRLEELPRLSNGKVDREALRALPMERAGVAGSPNAALDPHWVNTMQAIWADVLKVEAVNPADNFFELGGDSLLSINVVARAKRAGIELRPSHLFDFPTIEELGLHLEEEAALKEQGGEGGTVRSRNVAGSRTPFFMVHGGRRVLSELQRVLGDEQPLHVQPAHWDSGDVDIDVTLDRLATQALSNLMKLQAEGPYLLGGYSFGAVIAIEMVRRLEQDGQRVAMLFMLDPPEIPGLYRSLPQMPTKTVAAPRTPRPTIRQRLAYYRERLPDNANYWLAMACRALRLPETARLREARYRMHVARAYIRASAGYDIPTLKSPVVVFRATGGFHKADASIWQRVARGPLTVEEFVCDHEDLQWDSAMVSHWAAIFKQYLDKAMETG